MRPRLVTDEMYASIPTLLEQGMNTFTIAERFGVTVNSLKVLCSARRISLRRNRKCPRSPRPTTVQLPLSVSLDLARSLHEATKASGRKDPSRLVSDLLERIASDSLYRAVLDEEIA